MPSAPNDERRPDRLVRPKWWVACVLHLVAPTSAQFYAGRPRRAIIAFLVLSLVTGIALAVVAYVDVDRVAWQFAAVAVVICWLAIWVDGMRSACRSRTSMPSWLCIGYIPLAWAFHFVALYVALNFWLNSHFMVGRGMEPTLQAGDRMFIQPVKSNPPRRGDIILFYSDGPGSLVFLQRVVGLASDTVEVRQGQVYLNGSPLVEPYIILDREEPLDPRLENVRPTVVPDGHVYVMGDNRRNSLDSRIRGTTPMDMVIGRALVIYWSVDHRNRDTTRDPKSRPERFEVRWYRHGIRLTPREPLGGP